MFRATQRDGVRSEIWFEVIGFANRTVIEAGITLVQRRLNGINRTLCVPALDSWVSRIGSRDEPAIKDKHSRVNEQINRVLAGSANSLGMLAGPTPPVGVILDGLGSQRPVLDQPQSIHVVDCRGCE